MTDEPFGESLGSAADAGQWLCVARLADLPAAGGLRVEVRGVPIGLFRTDDGVAAIDDRCLHLGAALSVGQVEDGVVSCPAHGWRFRLADGAWLAAPRNRLACYAVRVDEAGLIHLRWPALTASPTSA
jgi:nitrite reductase/ring-hydroxylating ferredoxin subunit